MINLEYLDKLTNDYKTRIIFYNKLIKDKADYEIKYEKEFSKLRKEYNKINDDWDKYSFVVNNKILNDYDTLNNQINAERKVIDKILNGINIDDDEKIVDVYNESYVALNHLNDDGFDVVNLNVGEVINTDSFDSYKKEFLIKLLRKQNAFVGFLSHNDLPLMMNVFEDENEKLIEQDMNDECNLSVEDLSLDMGLQVFRAHMFDNKKTKTTLVDDVSNYRKEINNELPFIYDSKKVEDLWYKLDEYEKDHSEDDYWIEYYKLLILFDNKIETIYNEAPMEHKNYVIDAYYRFSQGTNILLDKPQEKFYQFRTASPIINEEVLKRKHTYKI